jgi:hypothetical protein
MATISKELIAPCGVNCFNCYVYLRPKNNCSGCRSYSTDKPRHCINCSRKRCAEEKKLDFCFECDKYPCTKIRRLQIIYKDKYSIDLHENGETLKRIGVDAFIKIEKDKWTCTNCGSIICQHNSICSGCNKLALIKE